MSEPRRYEPGRVEWRGHETREYKAGEYEAGEYEAGEYEAERRTGAGWSAKARLLVGRPMLAAMAIVVVVVGGAATAYGMGAWRSDSPAPAAVGSPDLTPSVAPPSAEQTSTPATATASPTGSATIAPAKPTVNANAGPAYGSNVDSVDKAPADKLRKPGALPRRPAGPEVTAIAGAYENAKAGYIGGKYVMMRRGEYVTLKGRGYLQVRYEIAWFNRPGSMVMPTWTGLKGKLFHVGSGGLRRMDDTKPDNPPENTWMGQPTVGSSGPASGYVVLPVGAQQMWQNEFFYLDGEVTLTNHERGADYNITATPKTWDEVNKDINTPPPVGGWVRYGLVRDTGNDGAPVPQYATRLATTDPAQVPQVSRLG